MKIKQTNRISWLINDLLYKVKHLLRAKTWQLSFNYDKSKVIHFVKKDRQNTYTMELGREGLPHKIEKS